MSALRAGIGIALIAAACGGREDETAIARARLSAGCVINSDCVDGLVCAYGRCHVACVTARDCPGGRCVAGPASVREAGVCQLDDERACVRNSDCPGPQLCGPDDVCRDACAADRDCRDGEVCAAGSCASVAEVASGALAPKSDAACRYASDCPGDLVCLRGRCDVECVGAKDCRVSWSCGGDTRCHPPGYVATLTACLPRDGAGGAETTGSVIASASGGGPSTVFDDPGSPNPPAKTFQCVVRSDGRTLCRGANDNARLGTGSATPASSATFLDVTLPERATSAALGGMHGCALGASGAAYCWGSNLAGATGVGTQADALPPGRVRTDAQTFLGPAVALRAAYDSTCAILADGRVSCWGSGTSLVGRGSSPPSYYAVPAFAAAGLDIIDVGFFSGGMCVLTRAGEVDCAGMRAIGVIADGGSGYVQPTPSRIVNLDGAHFPVRGMAIGYAHACALGADGLVLCWAGIGPEEAGVTDPQQDHRLPHVVAGLDHVRKVVTSDRSDFTCALRDEGDVRCWGMNPHDQLGFSHTVAAARGLPIAIPGVTGAIDVSVASYQGCARGADGRTVCWGDDAPPHVESVPCP